MSMNYDYLTYIKQQYLRTDCVYLDIVIHNPVIPISIPTKSIQNLLYLVFLVETYMSGSHTYSLTYMVIT